MNSTTPGGKGHRDFSTHYRNGVAYVQVWDQTKQQYLSARSTGSKDQKTARKIAQAMAADHNRGTKNHSKMGVVEYGKLQWQENSPLITLRRMGGENVITEAYRKNNLCNWEKHLAPLLRGTQLQDFRPVMFTQVYKSLADSKSPLSNSTVANIMNSLRVTLRHAFAMGDIPTDVVPRGLKISRRGRERDAFSDTEIQALVSHKWSDLRVNLMVQVAAFGGLRQGEILALRAGNLLDGSVIIDSSLSKVDGFKCTKSGRSREAVLPSELITSLRQLALDNPFGPDLVFWNHADGGPVSPKAANLALRDAMKSIGISEEAIGQRLLGYHALRHWHVSALRGKVPESLLGKTVGHTDPRTTDRYHHLTEDQRKMIGNAMLPSWGWTQGQEAG